MEPSLMHVSLRAHDLHQGLQVANIDRGSGLVGSELETTQLVGMAGALATAIKGVDVISDGEQIKAIANYQLDIPTFLFNPVLGLLEEAGYVRNVKRDPSGRVTSLYEEVPEFVDLYTTLDEVFAARRPGELEQALLTTIDDLSHGPRRLEDIDVDPDAVHKLLALGNAAEAIRTVRVADDEIAYSPYFAYEHPDQVASTIQAVDVEQVRHAFERVRDHQGLLVHGDPVLTALVAGGLMAAPGVHDPKNQLQNFAIAPYGVPPSLRTVDKSILDKAMAVVAAVRMGEHDGGITPLLWPITFLRRLLEGRVVGRHSSTQRQYAVLWTMGVVRFVGSGPQVGMVLIDNADNKRAVRTAIDLLAYGEAMAAKERELHADLATPEGRYRSPIQTVAAARKKTSQVEATVAQLWATLSGGRPVV